MTVAQHQSIGQQTLEINWYNSIKQPQVNSRISVFNWFEKIKGSAYSNTILMARNRELDYNGTKASLPCVTYNFLFDKYKKDENIVAGTGLLYIDIDNAGFDISSIDPRKVFAYYKSFGGVGYSIIVKVEDLTVSNFKATYQSITEELGISEFIDKQAIKASQFNVLSFDPDLFYNPNSVVFTATNFAPQSIVIRGKEKIAYTIDWGAKSSSSIKYDNLGGIIIEGDYTVNWNGYDYIKCFIPIKKVTVNRNNFLLSFCNNLVFLNPNISPEKALNLIDNVNQYACALPVDEPQLRRIVSSIFKYRDEGSLYPIYFKKQRKIVFSKKSKLTREEKLDICRNEIASKKTTDSKQKLYSILEQWNFQELGKITQRKIYQTYSISKKTVEKYWGEFKDYAAELNKNMQTAKIDTILKDHTVPTILSESMDKLRNICYELQKQLPVGQKLQFSISLAA